jgi:hypothetical protein
VTRRCELKRPGLRVRGRPTLPPKDIAIRGGIPVTSPVRTLIDVAVELEPLALERSINEADKRGLIDPETLRAELDGHAGEPGVKPLCSLLDKRAFRLSDSDLEILFRPDRDGSGAPFATHQTDRQRIRGRLLLARPGPDGGDGRPALPPDASDACRDRAHVLAGMTPLRFTHYEIKYERARVGPS